MDQALANCALDEIQADERLIARLRARQYDRLCTLAGGLGDHAAEGELAPALTITRSAAGGWMNRAHALTSVPHMFRLLREGLVDEWRVRVVREELAQVLSPDDPRWDAVDRAAAKVAPGKDSAKLRRYVHKLLISIDPHAAERDRIKALADRKVVKYVSPSGMSTILAELSGEDAALVMATLHAIADLAPKDDPRTRPQLLADAFAGLFRAVAEGRPLDLIPAPTPNTEPEDPRYRWIPEQWVEPDHDDGSADTDTTAPDADAGADMEPPPNESVSGLPLFVPDVWKPPALGTRQGERLRLVLHMDAETVAGGADVPGFLVGHGYITPQAGRDLARQCDSLDVVVREPRPVDEDDDAITDTCTRCGRGPGRRRRTRTQARQRRRAALTHAHGTRRGATRPLTPVSDATPGAARGGVHPTRTRITTDHVHHPEARTRYRPGRALARLLAARHQHCRAPGCTRPASQCDNDHGLEWPFGMTCGCNMLPLCRFHHNLKTWEGWRYVLHPDGAVTWITRLGRDYEEPPPDDLRPW